MKIHGKTLSEIFSELPWAYKIVFAASALFFAYTFFYLIYLASSGFNKKAGAEVVTVNGIGTSYGLLDPSLAVEEHVKNPRAFLAFGSMEKTAGSRDMGIDIRLASGAPPCTSWSAHPVPLFESRTEDLLAADGQTVIAQGLWQTETPALVYDPGDPDRAWKAFAYKYFWTGDMALTRRYSVIAYKYAADPLKEWSTEEWLFSADPQNPPMPYQPLVKSRLNEMSAELKDVHFYARPSVVLDKNVLVMSLSAFAGGKTPDRIVMLASADHGRSWGYIGSPLSVKDLPAIGPYKTLQGATLLKQEGKIYLAAVFGDDTAGSLGTFIFSFERTAKALLQKDGKTGTPLLLRHIPRVSVQPTETGGGFAAYNDACSGGIVTSEMSGLTKNFQIFRTQKKPAD